LVLAALATLASACSPGTEVVITVDSDELVAPDNLQKLCITVKNPSLGTQPIYKSQDLAVCPPGKSTNCYAFPISLTLTPGDMDPTAPVRVEVDALPAGATCTDVDIAAKAVTRDASVFTFTKGKSERLDFFLYKSCLNQSCAERDQACGPDGSCAPLAPHEGTKTETPDLGGSASCANAGAVALCDDFESGDVDKNKWTTVETSGTSVVDTQHVHRGKYAFHSSTLAMPNVSAQLANDAIAATLPQGIYFRAFVYLPSGYTFPAGLFHVYSSSVDSSLGTNPATGAFLMNGAALGGYSEFGMLRYDQWMCIEWEVLAPDGAGMHQVTVKLDGNQLTKVTGLPSTSLTGLSLGLYANGDGVAGEAWFDDVIVDSKPIGCAK
jgi:hypothetical protein